MSRIVPPSPREPWLDMPRAVRCGMLYGQAYAHYAYIRDHRGSIDDLRAFAATCQLRWQELQDALAERSA